MLTERSFAEAVDRDWERADALGITAVPTFVIGEKKLVGAQEYRSLSAFVTDCGVARR